MPLCSPAQMEDPKGAPWDDGLRTATVRCSPCAFWHFFARPVSDAVLAGGVRPGVEQQPQSNHLRLRKLQPHQCSPPMESIVRHLRNYRLLQIANRW